jgi:CheY-like chemotaxis protein
MPHQGPQVLIVDDEWAIRQQLSRALVSFGIQCDSAVDAEDALDKYHHYHYPLVVTDLLMPQQNGHSLAVALLDQPVPPRVVALTGVTEPRLAKDLLARGVDDVVYKPVNYFEFADRLRKLLESAQMDLLDSATEQSEEASEGIESGAPSDHGVLEKKRHQLELLFLRSPPQKRWLTAALQWIDWHRVPNPPAEIRDFLREFAHSVEKFQTDRRGQTRIAITETAIAIPLDESLDPLDEPCKILMKNLSEGGIGLIHTRRVESPFLAVTWRSLHKRRVVVVAKVCDCRQLTYGFDIGCTIVA